MLQTIIDGVSNSDLWRYTGGRVSSALQTVIYFGAVLLHDGKRIVKVPVCSTLHCCGLLCKDKFSAYSPEGLERDEWQGDELVEKIQKTTIGFFMAPEMDYTSLGASLKDVFNAVILGGYNTNQDFLTRQGLNGG
jgi:hypothetical protein